MRPPRDTSSDVPMIKSFIPLLVFSVVSLSAFAASPYEWGDELTFSIKREGSPKHPFLQIFPDADNLEAGEAEVLSDVKSGRGKSKLYPAEDARPGLIVVFRSLAFMPTESGEDYEAIFEGEFNAVKFKVPRKDMEALFAGETIDLSIKSTTRRGFVVVAYTVESETELRMRLEGEDLLIFRACGKTTMKKEGIRKSTTCVGPRVMENPKKKDAILYRGVPGKLAGLDILPEK